MPSRIRLIEVQLTVPRLGTAKSGMESKAPIMASKMLSFTVFRGRTLDCTAKMLDNTHISSITISVFQF